MHAIDADSVVDVRRRCRQLCVCRWRVQAVLAGRHRLRMCDWQRMQCREHDAKQDVVVRQQALHRRRRHAADRLSQLPVQHWQHVRQRSEVRSESVRNGAGNELHARRRCRLHVRCRHMQCAVEVHQRHVSFGADDVHVGDSCANAGASSDDDLHLRSGCHLSDGQDCRQVDNDRRVWLCEHRVRRWSKERQQCFDIIHLINHSIDCHCIFVKLKKKSHSLKKNKFDFSIFYYSCFLSHMHIHISIIKY